jgi:hypothetical protein
MQLNFAIGGYAPAPGAGRDESAPALLAVPEVTKRSSMNGQVIAATGGCVTTIDVMITSASPFAVPEVVCVPAPAMILQPLVENFEGSFASERDGVNGAQ